MAWVIGLLAALLAGDAVPAHADNSGVRIVTQSGRWTGLLPVDDLQSSGDTMFLISGELENVGSTAIEWVKLGYELLGGSEQDPVVLASEYGYNRRAETLRGEHVSAPAPAVTPLRPGDRDLFRMVFFRSDVPPFQRWRVRILEVH